VAKNKAWKWVMVSSLILTIPIWLLIYYVIALYFIGSGDFWVILTAPVIAAEISEIVLIAMLLWDLFTVVMWARNR